MPGRGSSFFNDSTAFASSRLMSTRGSTSRRSLHASQVQGDGHMSAFGIHEDALYSEISNARKRMTHGHVALADATTNNHSGSFTASFCELWETEVSRIGDYLQAQQQNLEFSAKALLTNVEAALNRLLVEEDDDDDDLHFDDGSTSSAAFDLIQTWRFKTDELVHACVKLQRFANQNKEMLEEIGTYADEKLHTSCLIPLKRRFANAPWKTGPNSALIVVLSDVYNVIRAAEERQRSGAANENDAKWVAPTAFERSTTKYWVRDDQLTDLLLAAVGEAPLLVYGKSGRLTSKADCLSQRTEGDKLWDQLATPITSIYFDSPKMSLYKERLPRHEGAQLLRARWYGRKPTGDELIFLEMKTHHEKWINTKSVKERVSIREKDMTRFLSYEKWDLQVAEGIILAASPALDASGLQRAADRLLRMHELVFRHGLRPCVRTCYLRAAFQSSASNALRLTIDRNVTMIDESKTLPGSWCLPEDAVIQNTMATKVPFVVLEVKIAGDDATPPVIQDLEQRGIIQEATKFSKFLTGAAAFNMDKVDMLPHWAEHPAFAPVFSVGSSEQSSSTKNNAISGSIVTPAITAGACDGSADGKSDNGKSDTTSNTSQSGSKVDLYEKSSAAMGKDGAPRRRSTCRTDLTPEAVLVSKAMMDEDEPIRRSTLSRVSGLFRSSNKGKDQRVIAAKRPARVEPKSYFANERTFIQWISASLLLVTISVILLGIDSELGESSSNYAQKAGIAVCAGAVLIVFYATFVYFRRLRLLGSGNPYGYIDYFGPFVLAVAVCGGVVILLTHFIVEMKAQWEQDALEVYLHEKPGQCYLHSNRGISKLEYQPSDIVVDVKRNALLVPSVQRILLHSLNPPLPNRENRVETLIEIPNSNLEGLTVIGDRVFALSEGPKRTELIELSWNSHDELDVTHRWKLSNSQEAEAIAFVPDKTRRSGRLFIDVNGQIHIYNVPDLAAIPVSPEDDDEDDDDSLVIAMENADEPAELDRIGSLNNHVLKSGLTELKISSMFYFEGVAYILHDNEMLLRSWDLDEGDLLAEIPLPRVEGGFSKEWEGIALERREIVEGQENNSLLFDRGNLRGNTEVGKTQLILHLALDTPAQVWSMVVKEGPNRGELILPDCAVSRHASADSISSDESSDSIDG